MSHDTTTGEPIDSQHALLLRQLCLPSGKEAGRSHSRSFGILGKGKHTPYLEFDDDPAILDDLDELVVTFIYVQTRREKDERAVAMGMPLARHGP